MEELDCPFCHERMNVKKGLGLLANDYLECESCGVSFIAIGKNKYQLKKYKEKTFLEKHGFNLVISSIFISYKSLLILNLNLFPV